MLESQAWHQLYTEQINMRRILYDVMKEKRHREYEMWWTATQRTIRKSKARKD